MDEARPQTDDGYLRIANELFDAIVGFGFTKRQLTVLLAIIRKTYGYGKKRDDMTIQQLADITGIDRTNASKAVKELVLIGAVSKQPGVYGYVIEIKKNYRSWVACQNDTRVKAAQAPCQNGTSTVSKRHTQKTTTKDNKILASKNADFARFWETYPRRKSKALAEKAWRKISPDPGLADQIIAAVIRAKLQPNWQTDGMQFVPYPASWLNARGWEDDPAPIASIDPIHQQFGVYS